MLNELTRNRNFEIEGANKIIGFLHGFENGLGNPVTNCWGNGSLSLNECSVRGKDDSAPTTSVWITSTFLNHVGTLFLHVSHIFLIKIQ